MHEIYNDELLTDEKMEKIEESLPLCGTIDEAIWMLGNDTFVWGEYDMGMRGEDHRCIEVLFDNLNRYDNEKFWEAVHTEYFAIRLVPETMIALIKKGQEITKEQLDQVEKAGYTIEEY